MSTHPQYIKLRSDVKMKKTIRVSVDLKITNYDTLNVARESFATYVYEGSQEEMARQVVHRYIEENNLGNSRVACTYIAPLNRYF